MTILETKMKCPNCQENKWENVDKYRIKPSGMAVCTSCGFISYPSKWATPEEIKKHYRSDYRQPPTHQNMFACERKNHFHHKFLLETFEGWKKAGLENPKILEIGAAHGITLAWLRSIFPKAEIHGTELTTSMRRNAYHEYGIKLTEEIDETKKYDLIMTYKVLEHQLDPQLELEKYTRLLTPMGVLYISVPTWFNSLINFGLPGFDLEYYYDPNHINVWTKEVFENILTRAGFEITKQDQAMYSSTYLARPNGAMKNKAVLKLDPEVMKQKLEAVFEAFMAVSDNQYEKAIKTWPDYPQAWVSNAEHKRKFLTEKGWDFFRDRFVEPAIQECPTSAEILIMATDFAMRAEKWKEATEYSEAALAMKPENPVSLHQLTNIMREMALRAQSPKEKTHYFLQAREVARHLRLVSAQHFKEATDLIYMYNSKLSFPGETPLKTAPVESPITSGSAAPSSPSPQEVSL